MQVPRSIDLTFVRAKDDEKFRTILSSLATQYGISGSGSASNGRYFLRLEGTTAALDRFTDWILSNGSTRSFRSAVSSTEKIHPEELPIKSTDCVQF